MNKKKQPKFEFISCRCTSVELAIIKHKAKLYTEGNVSKVLINGAICYSPKKIKISIPVGSHREGE